MDLPFTLRLKYYEIVAKNGNNISAKCLVCSGKNAGKIAKDQLNAVTNFIKHLQIEMH